MRFAPSEVTLSECRHTFTNKGLALFHVYKSNQIIQCGVGGLGGACGAGGVGGVRHVWPCDSCGHEWRVAFASCVSWQSCASDDVRALRGV